MEFKEYTRDQINKDIRRCSEQFEKMGMKKLAKMKLKELLIDSKMIEKIVDYLLYCENQNENYISCIAATYRLLNRCNKRRN